MKALSTGVAIGLTLVVSAGLASAQGYDGRDYGYRDRGYEYRGRDYDDRDRDDRYGGRGRGYRERGGYAFDEREYLRCNPDVRRAVARGQMESGLVHWRTFGRREGRRLSC